MATRARLTMSKINKKRDGVKPDLFRNHYKMLNEESGISDEVIESRGYRSIKQKVRLAEKGFSPQQRLTPTLLIPLHSPDGEVRLFQHRPDEPRIGKNGKQIKYEFPRGGRMVLDVPPVCRDEIADQAQSFHTHPVERHFAVLTTPRFDDLNSSWVMKSAKSPFITHRHRAASRWESSSDNPIGIALTVDAQAPSSIDEDRSSANS